MKLKTFLLIAGGGLALLGGGAGLWFSSQEPPVPEVRASSSRASKPAPSRPTAPKRASAKPTDAAPAAAPAPAPVLADAPTAAPAAAPSGPAWQRTLLGYAGRDLGSKKKKDAVPGSVKVNIYQDDGEPTANRAKVDLDRDGKWDEKWTFKGTDISKKVSPGDDEDYSEAWDWDGSAWQQR
jgi:hypothetical protein